jgi:hypothetical protein
MWPAGTLCITIAAIIAKTGVTCHLTPVFQTACLAFIPDEGQQTAEYVAPCSVTMEERLGRSGASSCFQEEYTILP